MNKHIFPCLIASLFGWQAAHSQAVTEADVKRHVSTLASDQMEGRGTGYQGAERAAQYIAGQFAKLKLQPKGDGKTYFQAFTVRNSGGHGAVDTTTRTAKNVVGYLDNGAATTIVIGAHYDHLGLGHDGGSLDPKPLGQIHNGADDNASGVAGVLELAEFYARNKEKEKQNFLFICFSGEEMGLLGSKYFTEHPTVDLSAVNCMMNMDMIGRLPANNTLIVSGVGTSPAWGPVLRKHESAALKAAFDSSGVGASDHTSFYLKNIPVLHFFTGAHSDYHKPSDDADKINYSGEVTVLNYMRAVIADLDNAPRLVFTPTKTNTQSASRSMKVTLGVMPSYAADGVGMKIDAVSENKPAQKAGLQAGDVIIAIDDHAVKDVLTYMDALNHYEKGKSAQVKVKRAGEEKIFTVTF